MKLHDAYFFVESETRRFQISFISESDLDGFKRSSEIIHMRWMVSEDLSRPSEPATNQILDCV